MGKVVARTAHNPPAREPIRLAAGDQVEVGERDTEWPEFVFVTAAAGSGWVPARLVSSALGRATMLEPYNTRELATAIGDDLDVIEEDTLGGWLWCRARSGDEGWIPIKTTVASADPGAPPGPTARL
jgi:hypothetical protein